MVGSRFFAAIAFLNFCYCTQLACKIEANFDIIVSNQYLSTTPISSFNKRTRRQCVLECLSFEHGSSINHHAKTGECKIFKENITSAVRSLTKKDGWTFITASGKPGNTCRMLDPCQNNGACIDSCVTGGYTCVCDEFYYGKHCEKDLQTIMNEHCRVYLGKVGTHARFDGSISNVHGYNWRCYLKSSLTIDGLYYSQLVSQYFTRSSLEGVFKKYQRASEYSVGALGNSCEEQCSSLGKACNSRMRTMNSVYGFHAAGVECKHPKGKGGSQIGYYQYQDEPAYIPSEGYCYGFARLPQAINCTAKSPLKRRFCRCT